MRRCRPAAALALGVALAVAGCRSNGDESAPTTAGAPAATAATSTTTPAAYGPPVLLGRLDPAVDESSGLAASRRNPGLLWTHNDSGAEPVVYCADRQARSCGTWRVMAAAARDWEDMAAGPGPRAGQSYLYLGDIGDNNRTLTQVVVYRVPEPAAPAASGAGRGATEAAERIPLRYADGPHDAEALLVHPTSGDIYVVTKEPLTAGVYKAVGGVLERIASLSVGIGVVTGGDISPDGRRLALCTYASGFELELPAESAADFDAIWRQPLRPVELPPRTQGEAVAYRLDGKALLTTSERSPAPLQEVERR